MITKFILDKDKEIGTLKKDMIKVKSIVEGLSLNINNKFPQITVLTND